MSASLAMKRASRIETIAHQALALAQRWNNGADDIEIRQSANIVLSELNREKPCGLVAATRILMQAVVGFMDAGPSMKRSWNHVCGVVVELVQRQLVEQHGG